MNGPGREVALDALGIVRWERRSQPVDADQPDVVSEPAVTTEPAVAHRPEVSTPPPGLGELAQTVAGCRRCALHENRRHTVFGVGNPGAKLMIIGEAPGAEEDRRGEPFVGRAGGLLDAMIAAIGLERSEIYIANIIKCRPPRNRDPEVAEVEACSSYLREQIGLVGPRLILAVGRFAAQSLTGSHEPIGRLRGQVHDSAGYDIPVLATYHPAYLLRSPREKAKTWDDLKRVRSFLDEARSPAS